MRRTKFTYGQLDRVLRSLGFSCRLNKHHSPTRVYDHKQTGATIFVPNFPPTDKVLEYHPVTERYMLDQYGIADPSVFEVKLQKVG